MAVSTAIAASLAAAAVGGYGAYTSGQAAAASAKANAQLADANAKIAAQDRLNDIETARIASEDKRRENRRIFAANRAALGSSGLELAGSPLDVLTDTSMEMALDERRVEYEGQVRGREGAIKILGLGNEAALSRASASASKTAGMLGAGSSLLSGIGSAASIKAKANG